MINNAARVGRGCIVRTYTNVCGFGSECVDEDGGAGRESVRGEYERMRLYE
jgi:hypothetical protein